MIPLKWLREFIVAVLNLLEAEGRALRAGIVRTAVAIAGLLIAAAILFTGLGLLAAAIIVALTSVMPTAWALVLGAVVCLVLAGGAAWLVLKKLK